MSRYEQIINEVFHNNFKPNKESIEFGRSEFDEVCEKLNIQRIKNLGDIIYSFRYRTPLPDTIQKTAPPNCEWIILGRGVGKYEFRLGSAAKIKISEARQKIKIPDSTPEILKMYAPGMDEQALLTKVRYNRLIDIFTGLTTYSIQNHFRTTVTGIGQIEVDEIYIGVNKAGVHYVIPCQAKSPGDSFGVAQVYQDIKLCAEQYPSAICRPMAIQFTGSSSLAILELTVEFSKSIFELLIIDEKHYELVPNNEITESDLISYKNTSGES